MLLNYQRVTTTLLGDFETFIQAAAWIRKILVNHSPVRHLNTHVFHMFGPLVPRFSIFLSCDPFFEENHIEMAKIGETMTHMGNNGHAV